MHCFIRPAVPADREAVFALVAQFATSFAPNQAAFEVSFARLLTNESACVLVAEREEDIIGYCLGFEHDTFYANGPVAWVEEIMVQEDYRRDHIGQRLMTAFEAWAAARGSILVALATRRAAPFYKALGYEDSAIYFRKILPRPGDDPTNTD